GGGRGAGAEGLAAGARGRGGTARPGGRHRYPGAGAWPRSLPLGIAVLRADPGCTAIGTAHGRLPSPARPARRGPGLAVDGGRPAVTIRHAIAGLAWAASAGAGRAGGAGEPRRAHGA